jgi:hypothetical protein
MPAPTLSGFEILGVAAMLYQARRSASVTLLFFVGLLDAVKIALQSESFAGAVNARHSAKL